MWERAESLGRSRMMGPGKVADGIEIGGSTDPEGYGIGLGTIAAHEG